MSEVPEKDMARISIVMPSFNQAAYLEEAIQSVLGQEYANTELIVIDGGSSDGSVDILHRYSKHITHWESAPDNGQSDALNKGLSRITGDIVGWLNSDDTYTAGTFQAAARVFQDESVEIAMSSHFGLMDAQGRVFANKENLYTNHKTLIRFWATNGMTINQPCVFFRRRVLDGMNPPLDTGLHYAMDYDLWLRLTLRNDIKVVAGQWANYRFHDASKSGRSFDTFFPEWYAVSRRYWGSRLLPGWWFKWIGRVYFHYPRRYVLGLIRRLKSPTHV